MSDPSNPRASRAPTTATSTRSTSGASISRITAAIRLHSATRFSDAWRSSVWRIRARPSSWLRTPTAMAAAASMPRRRTRDAGVMPHPVAIRVRT